MDQKYLLFWAPKRSRKIFPALSGSENWMGSAIFNFISRFRLSDIVPPKVKHFDPKFVYFQHFLTLKTDWVIPFLRFGVLGYCQQRVTVWSHNICSHFNKYFLLNTITSFFSHEGSRTKFLLIFIWYYNLFTIICFYFCYILLKCVKVANKKNYTSNYLGIHPGSFPINLMVTLSDNSPLKIISVFLYI